MMNWIFLRKHISPKVENPKDYVSQLKQQWKQNRQRIICTTFVKREKEKYKAQLTITSTKEQFKEQIIAVSVKLFQST